MSAGLLYGYSAWTDFYAGSKALSAEDKRGYVSTPDWQLRMHLMSLQAGVDLAQGFGVQLTAPFVRAESTRTFTGTSPAKGFDQFGTALTETADQGLGDLEARLRVNVNTVTGLLDGKMPRIVIQAGAAAPTGNFIVKGQADTSRYVSVGRGVWWILAGADVSGGVTDWLGYLGQVAARVPLGTLHGVDGYLFRWGPELRVNAGPTFAVIPGLLSAALGAEMQWRDPGQERIYSGSDIEKFPNGGGTFWTATATIQVQLPANLSLIANGRLPFAYDATGIQPVIGPGVFAGVNWNWAQAAAPAGVAKPVAPSPWKVGEPPRSSLIAGLLVPGKITIVDYWATWCEPCKKLAPQVEAFAAGRADVVLRKVDATDWGRDDMNEHLPAVAGLPVLDIYGPDGKLVSRRVGPPCFEFAADVPAPMPAEATPAQATPANGSGETP